MSFRIGLGATTTPTVNKIAVSHPGLAAGSGYNRGDGAGILAIGGDGESIRLTASVPTSGSCEALVSYFTVPS